LSNNEQEILKISRLLEPKYQDDLLCWVNLAYVSENSIRKSLGLNVMTENAPSGKMQDCSCEKIIERRKK